MSAWEILSMQDRGLSDFRFDTARNRPAHNRLLPPPFYDTHKRVLFIGAYTPDMKPSQGSKKVLNFINRPADIESNRIYELYIKTRRLSCTASDADGQ
jgi:hypothetical protein